MANGFVSKLEQAKVLMLDEMGRQGLVKGDRIPSRPLWCKRLNISNDTLDRALRQLIEAGVLTAKPGSGTFLNQDIMPARTETPNQTRVIDVFVPHERDQLETSTSPHVHMRRLDGIAQACRRHAVAMSLNFLNPRKFLDLSDLVAAIRPLHDAAVFTGGDVFARMGPYLKEARIPFAVVTPIPLQTNTVMAAVTNGYRELMAHLASIGRKRMAYISSDPVSPLSFLPVVEAAANAAGVRMERIYWVDRDVKAVIEKLITQDLSACRLDAILCRNDFWALETIAALKRQGVRVPEDVVVAGCDDVVEAAESDPPLATLAQPFEKCGEVAVDSVLRMIESRTLEFPNITIESQFVLRASAMVTAPVREEKAAV